MSKIRRVNLSMSQDLYDYYKEKADAMGVAYSNLIVMALWEHREQKQMLLESMQGFVDKLASSQAETKRA